MFTQVIHAKCKDPAALRARSDAWMKELAPGAKGAVGATEGVADDGTFVAVVRFESEEAAKANSERPEQGKWWEETSKLLEDVKFYDCTEVTEYMGGGSDEAGFVQVMTYKPSDLDALRAMTPEFEASMPADRADMLGGTSHWSKDGTVFDVNYFTTEKAAREGEKQEMPTEAKDVFERFMAIAGDIEYIDLRDPWLYSL